MGYFDPSPNQYTNQMSDILGSLAVEEFRGYRKRQQDKKDLEEQDKRRKQRFEELKEQGLLGDGGYVSSYDMESGLPKISYPSPKEKMETEMMQQFFGQGNKMEGLVPG